MKRYCVHNTMHNNMYLPIYLPSMWVHNNITCSKSTLHCSHADWKSTLNKAFVHELCTFLHGRTM